MTLSAEDQRDLDKFFQLGYFEKSTCGPMLDRLYLYSDPQRPDGDITARPTAEVRESPKSEPSLEHLELFGRVTRKLAMLPVLHRRVIEAYYGDAGACCATRLPTHGAIVAVYALTRAGRSMIKADRAKAKLARKPILIGDLELVQNLVAERLREQSATPGRLAEVAAQAYELKERAEASYTKATETLAEIRGGRR